MPSPMDPTLSMLCMCPISLHQVTSLVFETSANASLSHFGWQRQVAELFLESTIGVSSFRISDLKKRKRQQQSCLQISLYVKHCSELKAGVSTVGSLCPVWGRAPGGPSINTGGRKGGRTHSCSKTFSSFSLVRKNAPILESGI